MENAHEEIPMNWYKFSIYFRCPVGLFVDAGKWFIYLNSDNVSALVIILYIFVIAFEGLFWYSLITRKEECYIFVKSFLIFRIVIYVLSFLHKPDLIGIIITILEYSYFTKRKTIFVN